MGAYLSINQTPSKRMLGGTLSCNTQFLCHNSHFFLNSRDHDGRASDLAAIHLDMHSTKYVRSVRARAAVVWHMDCESLSNEALSVQQHASARPDMPTAFWSAHAPR